MQSATKKLSLVFGIFLIPLALTAFVGVTPAAAQSNTDNFQITSSKDISAIQGESFTYFVVTANNTDYQLQSELPSGLSFQNGSITGTPQVAGDYQLEFAATDGSGTQIVNLTVLSPGGTNGSQVAQAGSEFGGSGAGASEGGDNVSLDEIPNTGLSADQTITLTFYLLALLLISTWAVTRFAKDNSTEKKTRENAVEMSPQATTDSKAVGDGVTS